MIIFFFRDPAVQALQFLECIHSKDTNQKAQFFRNSLVEVFPIIPKKLWLQNVWPFLQQELCKQEVNYFSHISPHFLWFISLDDGSCSRISDIFSDRVKSTGIWDLLITTHQVQKLVLINKLYNLQVYEILDLSSVDQRQYRPV